MWPVILELGPIRLYSFGLMAALAFLAGSQLLRLELNRRGYPEGSWSNFAVGALLGGFVGARVNYLVTHLAEFRQNPIGSTFSGSGLVWYGGLVGGILVAWFLNRRTKRTFLELSDAFAPALTVAYMLGRVGCFVSGDGDYGKPSNVPWAMAFPHGIVPTTDRVHPTPIYEILMCAPILWLLWRTRHRAWPAGKQFGLYLALTGIERFVVEFWRRNPPEALGLTTAQWFGIGAVAFGVWLFLRQPGSPQAAPAGV
jgi:phosphatidylglycerol---prolipoprotein diacylglyceryl transferase